MSDVYEEVEAIAADMKEPGTFDLLEAVKDTAYPTGETTVYLNGKLANELNDLRGDLDLLKAEANQGIADPDQMELQEKIDAVVAEVRKTRITFHMRGVAPAVRKAIAAKAKAKFRIPKDADDDAKEDIWLATNAWITNELIRHSIVKAVDAKGNVAEAGYTNEQIQQLADVLFESEFGKLDTLCAKLTKSSQLFSETLDADFLLKPSADQ